MTTKTYQEIVVGLVGAMLVMGLALGLNIRDNRKNDRELVELRKVKVVADSFLAEADSLLLMQKTMLIRYPNISKYEAKYYSYVFRDFSKQYHIDWCVYPAKIRIESNFNPTWVSGAGARGLCQLMPGTAEEQAGKLGIHYIKGVTEWNEINNVVMGCNYLSEGIKDSGIEFGLRRYCSGNGKNKSKEVTDYYNNVFNEYQKVHYSYNEYEQTSYIFKGIKADQKK